MYSLFDRNCSLAKLILSHNSCKHNLYLDNFILFMLTTVVQFMCITANLYPCYSIQEPHDPFLNTLELLGVHVWVCTTQNLSPRW